MPRGDASRSSVVTVSDREKMSVEEQQRQTIANLEQQLAEARAAQSTLQSDRTGTRDIDANIEEIKNTNLKLPSFWQRDPALWFAQVEAQFHAYRIRADHSRYYTVVAALDCSVLQAVSDILTNPPETNKYETIKTKLISAYSDSQEKQLRRLLNELELGDRKPSQLLREMRTLAGVQVNEEVLRTLWLQRLPAQIHLLLSASECTGLEKMASVADKLTEIHSANAMASGSIAAITDTAATPSNAVAHNDTRAELQNMRREVAALTTLVEQLSTDRGRRFGRDRSNSRERGRSQSRSGEEGLCFYHNRFGRKARKCRQPCKFSQQGN